MLQIFKKMFEFVLFIQVFTLFTFIANNINNLENLIFKITILNHEYSFTVNFYALIGVIALIFGVIIAISITILDSGLSEIGVSNVSKFMGYSFLYLVLNFALLYQLQQIPEISRILLIIITLIYVLKIIDTFLEG